MESSKEAGIRAVNQAFTHYDQVRKQQVYALSEQAGSDRFDDEFVIPVCDMSAALAGDAEGQARFADKLGAALERIGFAILTGHGVDPALYSEAEARVAEFFTATTRAQRERYLAKRHGSVNQGYFPIKETSNIHPDLVEGWVFCRRAFALDGRGDYRESDFWPLPGYEPFFRQIARAHERLILPVMQSMLRYLGCDPHLYDRKLTGTNFGLRLNYYPPIAPEDWQAGGGRMLGHEDVDLFTLLPASSVGGLQVLNRDNMKWIRLDPPPGSIILNTGDYMQRITNDRLPSTTHRVSRPRAPGAASRPRMSIPMAIYTWEDEILEVLPGLGEPKYPPIRAEVFHTRITSKYYGDDYAVEDAAVEAVAGGG